MFNRKQRLGKKAAKLMYKLYIEGVTNLSIDIGNEQKLEVFSRVINVTTVKLRDE